jgi:hypothetical protein
MGDHYEKRLFHAKLTSGLGNSSLLQKTVFGIRNDGIWALE